MQEQIYTEVIVSAVSMAFGAVVTYYGVKFQENRERKLFLFNEFYLEFLKITVHTTVEKQNGSRFSDFEDNLQMELFDFFTKKIYLASKELQNNVYGFFLGYTHLVGDTDDFYTDVLNDSYYTIHGLIIEEYEKLSIQLGYTPYGINHLGYREKIVQSLSRLKDLLKLK